MTTQATEIDTAPEDNALIALEFDDDGGALLVLEFGFDDDDTDDTDNDA